MKDEYKLPIDLSTFRSTNAAWNYLMLNDPWSVGYVTTLIESRQWKSKEDWENFYFSSGQERERLAGANFNVIENFQLVRNNKNAIYALPWDIKNLNYQYGRTKEDLMRRAQVLYDYMKSNGSSISLEDCYECVRYRTICETWNGVVLREENTVRNLQSIFGPEIEIRKTSGEIDHTYAVDYEVYKNGVLKFGIQIKPQSYYGKAPYLDKARTANALKFQEYKEKLGCPVYVVTSKTSGEIQNAEIIKTMQKDLL